MQTIISIITAILVFAILTTFIAICKNNGRFRNDDEQERSLQNRRDVKKWQQRMNITYTATTNLSVHTLQASWQNDSTSASTWLRNMVTRSVNTKSVTNGTSCTKHRNVAAKQIRSWWTSGIGWRNGLGKERGNCMNLIILIIIFAILSLFLLAICKANGNNKDDIEQEEYLKQYKNKNK